MTSNWWYEKQLISKENLIESERPKPKEEPLKILEVLQKCRKGKVQYDTGWDTQPLSILKLISDVQSENQRYIQNNVERAVLIVEQSATRNEDHRSSNYITPGSKNVTNSFYTANNTLSSPNTEKVDSSAQQTPGQKQSLKSFRNSLGCLDEEYDQEADAIALATQSPIFAQFEKLNEDYEKGRIASWLSNCRTKIAEIAAWERENEAARREVVEKHRHENEERRKAAAHERAEKKLSMDNRIAEQRRRLELQSEMHEREFNRVRQQVEKEKLDQLEEQRRKEEEEAKILAQEEAGRILAEEAASKLDEEIKAKALQEQNAKENLSASAGIDTGQEKNCEKTTKLPDKIPPEFRGAILTLDLYKYLQSQKHLEVLKESIAHISSTSERTKSFYFAAMKVVNTPLNAISTNSSHSQLQVKITHFLNLLDGKPVYIGETMTTPFLSSSETNGSIFVLNLLAYRFVKKSESEMMKGDKNAGMTPLATLGAQLAKRYPEWSMIVRAYFYKLCPFLVPFHYPRKDLTVQQYAIAIGQDLSGNERAIQQVLLERITGYCTLYVLMAAKFEELVDSTVDNDFFTIGEVWRILAATLHVEPQLDVTATVLHTILETIGDKLAITYKIQFRKFLQTLTDSYLTKILNVTAPGKAAALTRLELFLESKATNWFRNR